jgi:exopolysaccharide production protein ExoQ
MTRNSLSRLWQHIEPWFCCWVILQYAGLGLDSTTLAMSNTLNYVLTIPFVLNHWKKFRSAGTKDFFLLLLHALAIASFFWSGAPDATSDRLKALIRTTILGIGLAVAYTPKQQTQLLLRTALIAGILSLLTIPAAVASGFEAFYGIFSFKNGLGLMMAIGGILALNTALNQKRHRGLMMVSLCGAVILLFLSRSGTSLISFIIAILMIPLHSIAQRHYKLRSALAILTLLLGTGTVVLVYSNLESLAGFFGKDLTLTGRLPLWEMIIQAGLKHPWTGYGYGAFWFTNDSIEAISRTTTGWPDVPLRGEYLTTFHSHSGYIEFFTNLGFVGLALFAFHFLSTLFRVVNLFWTTKTIESLWMLQFLPMMLFINFTEVGTILASNQTVWILYVSVSITSLIQKRQLEKQQGSRYLREQTTLNKLEPG